MHFELCDVHFLSINSITCCLNYEYIYCDQYIGCFVTICRMECNSLPFIGYHINVFVHFRNGEKWTRSEYSSIINWFKQKVSLLLKIFHFPWVITLKYNQIQNLCMFKHDIIHDMAFASIAMITQSLHNVYNNDFACVPCRMRVYNTPWHAEHILITVGP